MSAFGQPNPAPTQSIQQSYEVLCPTLWLEAELRRNSERSGLGGPNTRFTKSHEDMFWEEFERLLECGVDYVGRDYADFKNLKREELRPLVSECFRRSTSDFTKRLDDPRWNLGKSRDEIVDQILEELLSLRGAEVVAGSQSHVAVGMGREGGEEEEEAQELEIEGIRVPNLDRDETQATLVLSATSCTIGCELDRDEELLRKL